MYHFHALTCIFMFVPPVRLHVISTCYLWYAYLQYRYPSCIEYLFAGYYILVVANSLLLFTTSYALI